WALEPATTNVAATVVPTVTAGSSGRGRETDTAAHGLAGASHVARKRTAGERPAVHSTQPAAGRGRESVCCGRPDRHSHRRAPRTDGNRNLVRRRRECTERTSWRPVNGDQPGAAKRTESAAI